GRLMAFFFLYMVEGIPLGLNATAISTQMRRQGVSPEMIGAFVGSLYIPWGLKWIAGPFVDTFSSDRFGRRRLWIILMQIGMMLTLLVAYPINFATNLGLFAMVIAVHNGFAATMDVAIDALACNVLPESERGTANGFMFGGASIGQTIGGAVVLYLTSIMPFQATYLFLIGVILMVTVFIVLPLREKAGPVRPEVVGSKTRAVMSELTTFVVKAYRAFVGTRAALVGVLSALLPLGAYALSLALQSTLAVELGLDDRQVATINLWSTILFAGACITGGWFSDRFGRRRTLAFFISLTAVPTLYLAWQLQAHHWIQSIPATGSPSSRTTSSRASTMESERPSSWTSRPPPWPPRSSRPTWRCKTSPSRTRRPGRALPSPTSATRRRWSSTAWPASCRSCSCRSWRRRNARAVRPATPRGRSVPARRFRTGWGPRRKVVTRLRHLDNFR
ncbi:MAG: hypothetical protein FD129_2879, partial [bacterium]